MLKYSASDYIVKPYQVKRLESSIRSLAGVVRDFHYDTEQINDLRMTFDNYIEREIKFAERSSSPLSLILITTIQINADIESEEQASIDKPFIFSIAVKKARRALRATDTIVLNKGRDILIVLPCTDEHGAQLVSDKIKAEMEPEFEKIKSDLKEYIYPVHVTYPYDGDSFQALMHKAFMQVSSKELLEKIVSIPTDTLNYANKSYSRYQRLI